MRRRARNRRKRLPLTRRLPAPKELWQGLWRRRLRLLSLLAAGGLVAGSYAAGRYLATSDRFAVREAELRGAARVAPGDLADALAPLGGANVFRVNTARAEARVMDHPWVKRARVRRELPDRLAVEVVEREPVAVAYLGGFFLVDEDGLPFVRVRPGDEVVDDLVLITGVDRQAYAADPDAAHAQFRRAIAAANAYAAGDRPRLGELNLGARGELTFTTYDDAVAIRFELADPARVDAYLAGFDSAWEALTERERHAARLFRLQGSEHPERVTVDFSGLIAGN